MNASNLGQMIAASGDYEFNTTPAFSLHAVWHNLPQTEQYFNDRRQQMTCLDDPDQERALPNGILRPDTFESGTE
jgi:hypothetical protein